MSKRWLLVFTSCVVGCGPAPAPASGQGGIPFEEGLRRLCEVDQRAGLDPELDPITIESERYDWALANVEHPDVIELLTLMRVHSDAERVEMLRAAAREAQLSQCPLADTLEANPDSG